MNNPVVFISYSHDSHAHKQQVLALANRLRGDGCETILDQYLNGTPPEKWPRWMLNSIERATHVLCICTPTYYRRFRGHEVPGVGKGVDWEGAIITQEIYDSRSLSKKFMPVLGFDATEPDVPEPLRGCNRFHIETGYEALYDEILEQTGVEAPAVGLLRKKPRTGATSVLDPQPDTSAPTDALTEPTEDELDETILVAVEAIENLATAVPGIGKFLGPDARTGSLLGFKEERWTVKPEWRSGRANVVPVLKSMWDRHSSFSGPALLWDAWERIIGGVLVLGVDPRWVWSQRKTYERLPVSHPSRAEAITIENSQMAKFLPHLATAIAGGITRLERVFGPIDDKAIPDFARALPTITAAGRTAEIKRHFIRYVLKPSDEINVDALEGAALDTFFDRVRQILYVANKIDQDPYLSAGENLSKVAHEVKLHLELSDLYLFVPDEAGDESTLMTDTVIALSLAKRLREYINQNRPSI